ncbi:effector-associated constant component EACC1 [Pseudonocardia zijingensis]|jgi:hypothetical protein|uniref:Uncharacterized protein n=1 Tax=Pseudonocardia zijingensis TaxID=153376 RepID=A0ABP3YLS9_9PSEU
MTDAGPAQRTVDVRLELQPDPESSPEERELAVRRLRRELSEIDLDTDLDVVRTGGAPAVPPGSKAADPVTIGAIVLAMSASGGVFAAVVETIKDWLNRQADRHRITLTVDGDTIELARATAEERETLVEAFVRRHSAH